jgi:hypothetical protein
MDGTQMRPRVQLHTQPHAGQSMSFVHAPEEPLVPPFDDVEVEVPPTDVPVLPPLADDAEPVAAPGPEPEPAATEDDVPVSPDEEKQQLPQASSAETTMRTPLGVICSHKEGITPQILTNWQSTTSLLAMIAYAAAK